ncbi:MAG: hypothetical protein K5756_06935 [Clostridiales bacterium]|nr:hypothetical protein [Clostridiales bacterium]
MKKNKVIILILTVLAALSIIFLVFATNYVKFFKPKAKQNEEPTADISGYSFETSKYSAALKGKGNTQLPIIPTDIDGIYYSMDTNGAVTFYTLSANSFVPYTQGVNTFDTKVTCTNQELPVTMYCVERDSKVCGYGLFTSRKSPGVKIFDYAFCKITDMPAAFGKGSLMLVSMDKTEFALKNKTYSEAFSFDMSSKKTGSPVFTNNGRLTGIDGAFRDDWIKLTDDFIRSLGSDPYFVTGREYNIGVTETKNDIMMRNGTSKSKTVVSGIVGSWARGVSGNGIAYIRSTNVGFESVSTASSAPIASFAGNYFTDYVHSGNYLLKRSDLTLTNLLTGRSVKISGVNLSGSIVTFSVNPAETAVVIVSGKDIAAAQTVAVCDLASGAAETFTEPLLFAVDYPEITWISDTSFIHTRPVVNDGSKLNYAIYERGGSNA